MRDRALVAGLLTLWLLVPLSGACRQSSAESSADVCSDGLDNDNNGKVDCDDPGCRNVAFCRTLPPADGSPLDGAAPHDGSLADRLAPRDAHAPDHRPPDQRVTLDRWPDSYYGRRCDPMGGTLVHCRDHKSSCFPVSVVGGQGDGGFCTYTCLLHTNACEKSLAGYTTSCGVYQGSYFPCRIHCNNGQCPFDTQCTGGYCY